MSGIYFATFGVRPFVGRLLAVEDDNPAAAPVAVIDSGPCGTAPIRLLWAASLWLNEVPTTMGQALIEGSLVAPAVDSRG